MARPRNPLDDFVTYTPHYELHAANSVEMLMKINSVDNNAVSLPKKSNNTLLINTRKDAHQHIDNVRFTYLNSGTSSTGALESTGMKVFLEVSEPNGMNFVEKIKDLQVQLKCDSLNADVLFGLKIFWVGRLEDGSEKTIPSTKILVMIIKDISAQFDHQGGKYRLEFDAAAAALNPSANTGIAKLCNFVDKNISFKANTVQEAIVELEKELNSNYENVYATKLLNATGAKSIRYKINLDNRITGQLNLVTKDTFAKGEKCQLTFTPDVDICTMIRSILISSKELNDVIASSADGLSKQFHPGVKIPIIKPYYNLSDNQLQLTYNIYLYQGDGGISNTYEFDYWFSDPGKNVDVMEFEVKFPKLFVTMGGSDYGTELNRNADSSIPAEFAGWYASNVVHEDITRPRITNVPLADRKSSPASSGGVALLPATNRAEGTGYAKLEAKSVSSARLAFETYSNFASAAGSPQISFTIRGHYNLYEGCVSLLNDVVNGSDESTAGFGTLTGTWIKVNIFNSDKEQFFYTGYYRLISVDNIFMGGKFLQILTCQMMEESEANDLKSGTKSKKAIEAQQASIKAQNDRELNRVGGSVGGSPLTNEG